MEVHTEIFTATSESTPEEVAKGIAGVAKDWPFLNSHEPFARKLQIAIVVTASE